MKIVMLSGPSNCGKTTTLNLVYDELVNRGATVKEPKKKLGGDVKDFGCILYYQDKTVAFFSMGDLSRPLCEAMSRYRRLQCDLLVCACNEKFKRPYRKIKAYPGSVVIKKSKAKDRRNQAETGACNRADRDKIIDNL